jgi:hypothetical protein
MARALQKECVEMQRAASLRTNVRQTSPVCFLLRDI